MPSILPDSKTPIRAKKTSRTKPVDHHITYALSKTSQPMFIMDEFFNLTWCNQAYVAARGIPEKQILGDCPPFLKTETLNISDIEGIKENILTGENWTTEIEYIDHTTKRQVSSQIVLTSLPKSQSKKPSYFVIQNDITEQKKKYNHLWQMANYDSLTGIANRSLFSSILQHTIAQANRSKILVQVLFLDLDGFKQVNDNFGHDAGDFVLVEVTRRIQKAIRDADFVARVGGDEFAIILVGAQTTRQALSVSNKIISLVNKPMVYKKQSILSVGVSIGIATYPMDGSTAAELKNKADEAMYEAKKSGKNRVYTAKLMSNMKHQSVTAA